MIFNVTGRLLDACVLGLLQENDTYGYDLNQKIAEFMEVSESTLYPVLRRLTKENALTSYDKPYDGRNRKYYHITEVGQRILAEYKENWQIHSNIVSTLLEGGKNHDKRDVSEEIGEGN
ncbi:MAG: PadR family transcriptional regulator [Eubacteriales bacterium]